MRFHLHLLPTYFPDRDIAFAPFLRNILDQVVLGDELGWECFWFTEHHFLRYGGAIPNPAVMMSAAATRTSRIRLGCAISILPLHHPVQIAEDYAMVDAISGGRLDFGIGRGNTDLDYRVYGIDRSESQARMYEAIDVIRRAWREERFSHEGRFWRFEECSLYPKPVQQPLPPIWLAGMSAQSMRWAGEQGFNVMTVAHASEPESLRKAVAAWREGLVDGEHDPARYHNKLHLRVYVNSDREKARRVAEDAIVRYENVAQIGRRPGLPDFTHETYDWKGMLAQGRNVYGNPDDCIRLIQTAAQHYDFDVFSATFNFGGIEHHQTVESMRLFAKEVMPAFS
jgi:alkanesulfonate monooxygenase SsuD/methylene tetrahydromethanopterin reductase-like flavin-dependent oxidoreductase (luciferase family)